MEKCFTGTRHTPPGHYEILKSILQTPYTNLTGRGQAVKAAVQDDVLGVCACL